MQHAAAPARLRFDTSPRPLLAHHACGHTRRCGFCEPLGAGVAPGTCLAAAAAEQCAAGGRHAFYRVGCPGDGKWTVLVVLAMLVYLAAFSPGMSPVPWAVNAEIYPLQVRSVVPPPPSTEP